MFEFTATTWFILIILFFIIEACTTNFFTIWFAFGALAALLTSLVCANPVVQATVFVLISAILVIATFPLIQKMRAKKKAVPLNADRNIGRTALVLTALTPGEHGRVQLDGVDWNAISDHPMMAQAQCRVVSIHSTVLTVEPILQTAHVS